MTTITTRYSRSREGVARWAALLGFALAIIALLLLAAGPIGWRAGWWHYRVGLQTLMPDAGYAGLAAIAVSALAVAGGWRRLPRGRMTLAVLGLLLGCGVAYFPWHWNNQRGVFPSINDITTDFDDPPSLAFAAPARRAEHGSSVAYGGPGVAAVQKKSYPDVGPAMLGDPPVRAFERVLAAARALGWKIIKSDPAAGIVDATEQSRWFGFTDDIAIRVTPSGGGSRVDIRSASRQGRGDLGANAKRVRGFLAALQPGGK